MYRFVNHAARWQQRLRLSGHRAAASAARLASWDLYGLSLSSSRAALDQASCAYADARLVRQPERLRCGGRARRITDDGSRCRGKDKYGEEESTTRRTYTDFCLERTNSAVDSARGVAMVR